LFILFDGYNATIPVLSMLTDSHVCIHHLTLVWTLNIISRRHSRLYKYGAVLTGLEPMPPEFLIRDNRTPQSTEPRLLRCIYTVCVTTGAMHELICREGCVQEIFGRYPHQASPAIHVLLFTNCIILKYNFILEYVLRWV